MSFDKSCVIDCTSYIREFEEKRYTIYSIQDTVMYVFLNGQIVPDGEAKIGITDLSYQFGYGLFETIVCNRGIPLFIESHYRRLTQSAREIGMTFPIDLEDIKKWISDVLKANKFSSARIKIIVSKKMEEKFNVLIMASHLEPPPTSYALLCKRLIRDPNSVSFRNKTTSRADSFVAYKEATENGFNDALYLNEKNELVECTRANIFLVLEEKIITPALEAGILSGVTRSKIIEIAKKGNIHIEEKNVHSLYLNKAQGVFATNAIIGLMPVSRIKVNDKEYNFLPIPLITRLKNSYDAEVQQYINRNSSLQGANL